MKKTLITLLILIILFAINIQLVYSQSPDPTNVIDVNNSSIEKNDVTVNISVDELQTEISVLKGQLELMQNYDQRLLSTVFWSLGVVVTIFLTLIAYNWIVNNQILEKDKKNIKDELELNLSAKFDERSKGISLELENKKNELSESLNKEIESIKSDFESDLKQTKKELINIKLDYLMQDARNWFSEEVFMNAVTRYIEVLNLAKQIEFNTHHVGYALEGLLNSLKNLKEKKRLFPSDVKDINSILVNLPSEYNNYRESISKSIDEVLE